MPVDEPLAVRDPPGPPSPDDRGRPLGRRLDAAAVVALTVASFALRWGGRPRQGLWYDDAWVAVGAVHGSVTDIPLTGSAHPGFTLLLWLQHHILGGGVERLAGLAVVFGVMGPALVYVALRLVGVERSTGLLVSAGVAVSAVHVIYSGRVKSYTIDTALVVVLAVAVALLADRRWTWLGSAGWIAAAVAVGSMSGYLIVASAVAIGILVLHPAGDRPQRVVALAVQGVVQAGSVVVAHRYVDLDEIEEFMEGYDAHVELSANPVTLASNLVRHLSRVVAVHPGGPEPILGLVGVAVVAGLVLGATGRFERPRTLASRYALALLVVAAVGSLAGRFPFGPRSFDYFTALGSPGARHSLWLVPVTAIGTANAVDLLVRRAGQGPRSGLAAAHVVIVTAAAWLVVAGWDPMTSNVGAGRRQLAAAVEQAAADGAYIVLDELASYQFVVVTDRAVTLRPTPSEMVGAVPEIDPDDGITLGLTFDAASMAALAAGDRDLLVLYGLDLPDDLAAPYRGELTEAGFVAERPVSIGGLAVTVWRRG